MKTAYPNTTTPVSITLYCNIPFDNTYKHHSMISSYFKKQSGQTQPSIFPNGKQENFLDRKNSTGSYIYTRWTLTDTFNFDFKNGLLGSVTLELLNAQTNANYLMVVSGTQKWFYFITGIMQSNIDTYTLTLELDVLMTYGDEFLNGMSGVPVFTKRKHCRRFSNPLGIMFSHDYKNGDSAYANIKPNIIKEKYQLEPEYRDYAYGTDTTNPLFKDVLWCYIVCDIVDQYGVANWYGKYLYRLKDSYNPFSIVCFPINACLRFKISYGTAPNIEERQYTIGGQTILQKLVSQEHFKGAKILPYPPFHKIDNQNITISDGGYYDNVKRIDLSTSNHASMQYNNVNGEWDFYKNGEYQYTFYFGDKLYNTETSANENSLLSGTLIIGMQKVSQYDFKNISPYDLYKPSNLSISSNKLQDPKLKLSPFTKYTLTSSASEEQQFYVELLVSQVPLSLGEQSLYVKSITTLYGGDYSVFTYITHASTITNWAYNNYKWGKVGLATTTNYSFPVGSDALEVFKSTQSQTYYQSKIASGITSGLTIAGGVATTGIGIGMVATGGGSPIGVGLIATGIGAMASGTAGVVDTIKSTNAKIEDLKNTPDSINVSGSSYAHDYAMDNNGLLPYILVYSCSPVVMNSANEYFYTYGYEISRPCYFNQLIKDAQPTTLTEDDTDLFGRTIFNYIQIEDDITTKINADIPYLIKQKLSSIFNNGITLWSFFGFTSLNNNSNESATYSLDKWLFKNTLDNTEYGGESYE